MGWGWEIDPMPIDTSEYKQASPQLWNTKVCSVDHPYVRGIADPMKMSGQILEDLAVRSAEQSGNILEQENSWFQFFYISQKVTQQFIPRVAHPASLGNLRYRK
jgi:hypothetical protein